MKKAAELQTLKEVAKFWDDYLFRKESLPEVELAGSMANVVTNDRWESWYSGPKSDPIFSAVYDLVADLEVPGGDQARRDEDWAEVATLVENMIRKYQSPDQD